MIVVIGNVRSHVDHRGRVAAGPAVAVAIAAVAASAAVQIVGRIGDDAAGEAALLDLAHWGIGHVAILRDAAHPTPEIGDNERLDDDETLDDHEGAGADWSAGFDLAALDAADVALALSYLPEYRAVVVAEPLAEPALAAVVAAAGWAGTALVVVGREGELTALPEGATVFVPPDDGSAAAFATMVGTYAAGLDRGDDPGTAFAAATAAVGSSATE